MFKTLSPEEIMRIAEVAIKESKQEPLTQKEKEKEFFRLTLGMVAKTEQKNTLKQVIEWGNEDCITHNPLRIYQTRRWQCHQCWAELQKEVEK